MNTTPAEIIKAALPSIKEINPQPKHAEFKFLLTKTGELAAFNEIETIECKIKIPIEVKATRGRPRKQT